MLKTCIMCHVAKDPLTAFHANRSKCDGRDNRCKTCKADQEKAPHRLATRREYDREGRDKEVLRARRKIFQQKPVSKARDLRSFKSRLEREPEKVAARVALQMAVARGDVIKPKECSRCHSEPLARLLHGHHHSGYDNPFDVVWLCRPCHDAEHRQVTNGQ